MELITSPVFFTWETLRGGHLQAWGEASWPGKMEHFLTWLRPSGRKTHRKRVSESTGECLRALATPWGLRHHSNCLRGNNTTCRSGLPDNGGQMGSKGWRTQPNADLSRSIKSNSLVIPDAKSLWFYCLSLLVWVILYTAICPSLFVSLCPRGFVYFTLTRFDTHTVYTTKQMKGHHLVQTLCANISAQGQSKTLLFRTVWNKLRKQGARWCVDANKPKHEKIKQLRCQNGWLRSLLYTKHQTIVHINETFWSHLVENRLVCNIQSNAPSLIIHVLSNIFLQTGL